MASEVHLRQGITETQASDASCGSRSTFGDHPCPVVPARAEGSAGGSHDRSSNDRKWHGRQTSGQKHGDGPTGDVAQSSLPPLMGKTLRADVTGQPRGSTCPGCLSSIKGAGSTSFKTFGSPHTHILPVSGNKVSYSAFGFSVFGQHLLCHRRSLRSLSTDEY